MAQRDRDQFGKVMLRITKLLDKHGFKHGDTGQQWLVRNDTVYVHLDLPIQ